MANALSSGTAHGLVDITVIEDGIVSVVMSRPPVNAISRQMYAELREVFGGIEDEVPSARVLMLRGAGKHFCAGSDLGEFAEMTAANAVARMRLVREAFAAIYECPVPTIAAVHGSALGAGTAIAACCDLVVCGESAMLGTPEVGVGVMGGGRHLARLVPEQEMRRMYFTGDAVPARDLLRFGGITSVVPDTELLPEALRLARRIARHSGAVLRYAKKSLNRAEFLDLKSGYESEQETTVELASHPDSIEARKALVEHRPPVYLNSSREGVSEDPTASR